MKGLDISREYYEEFGRPMLERDFPELMPYLAAGLFGSGSECLGYDDDVSLDHDMEPGFMLLLPGEEIVDRKAEFALERAYSALPKEYMGLKRPLLAPVGGARKGVMRTDDFFGGKLGDEFTLESWLRVPSYSLLEVTNGELFFDGYGEVTELRKRLSAYPEDIRRKKLAGNLLMMGQSGQYNFNRCMLHGEKGAAQFAAIEFAKHAMETVFLLNGRYMPFYKWAFRAMRELPKLSIEAELLEYLITTDNDGSLAEDKYQVMEGIAADVIDELNEQGLTKAVCMDLEKHAYSVNDGISDGAIRNMNIFAGV
ncbi:MAG: DUF4037 domain-containing protein [Clostridia bacterium]|nr:DUF4037 domain-containing protein [Clostridia bacterium]